MAFCEISIKRDFREVSLVAQPRVFLQDFDPTDTVLMVPGALWVWSPREWGWGFTFSFPWVGKPRVALGEVEEHREAPAWAARFAQPRSCPRGSEGMWTRITGGEFSLDIRMDVFKHQEEPLHEFCVFSCKDSRRG